MDIKTIKFKIFGDSTGSLIPLEANKNIPFEIKRVYYIFETLPDVTRGKHAHSDLEQILICTSGSCKIFFDDGHKTNTIVLDSPEKGLYIGKNIWREMYDFSPGCVLMVLASDYYKEKEYIRDYESFKQHINSLQNF